MSASVKVMSGPSSPSPSGLASNTTRAVTILVMLAIGTDDRSPWDASTPVNPTAPIAPSPKLGQAGCAVGWVRSAGIVISAAEAGTGASPVAPRYPAPSRTTRRDPCLLYTSDAADDL